MAFVRSMSLAAVFGLMLASGSAQAEGDPANGAKVFNKCKACHELKTEKNKVGPHLVRIFGRVAGSVEGFSYSEAFKKVRAEGLVWTEENIAKFVANPKTYLPGNRMAFAGLKNEKEIADLIAYLKQEAGGS